MEKLITGWREWLSLPNLGISIIRAKVDTGARTSALHAEDIEFFTREGLEQVRFAAYPVQRSREQHVRATARLIDTRTVRSSNGTSERRPVIETTLQIAGRSWPIELSLTSRDVMGFRMLLGRQALREHVLVDPGRSFLTPKPDTVSPGPTTHKRHSKTS